MIYIMKSCAANSVLTCDLDSVLKNEKCEKTLILWANLQSVYENTP